MIFVIYEQRESFGGTFEGEKDHRVVSKMTYTFDF